MKNTYLIAAVFIGCTGTVIMHGMDILINGRGYTRRGCPVWRPIPFPIPANGISWCQFVYAAATKVALKKTQ